jgi:hypothetical protein
MFSFIQPALCSKMSLISSIAGFTPASCAIASYHKIVSTEWMSSGAVCLSGINCHWRITNERIEFLRYNTQMLWINANCVAAFVIYYQSLRNLPIFYFVCYAMCALGSSVFPKITVTTSSYCPSPKPTASIRLGRDFVEEAFYKRNEDVTGRGHWQDSYLAPRGAPYKWSLARQACRALLRSTYAQ